MKAIFYLFVLFVTVYSSAQEKEFRFTNENGMTDYIVTPLDNMTTNHIYKKVLDWVKETYDNTNKVILTKNDNESILFEGETDALFTYNSLLGSVSEKTKYQIEITIKEGKYKFDLKGLQKFIPTTKSNKGGWVEIPYFDKNLTKKELNMFYKKDGSLRSSWKNIADVPTYFNNLNQNLNKHIMSNSSKTDNW